MIEYDCGCRVSVNDDRPFLLMCVKHTIELNQITDKSLEELR